MIENATQICSAENICSEDPRILSWAVDYSNELSLDNWIQKLGLMCEPDWKGAMLGSAGFFGQLLTLPILPLLADKFGRKNFFLGGRVIETILFSVLMYTTNWFVMVGVMLGFGMLATSRLTIGITYLVELFPKKH